MLIQFQEYLTFENIYVYSNFAVLPFWFLLILIPNSKIDPQPLREINMNTVK